MKQYLLMAIAAVCVCSLSLMSCSIDNDESKVEDYRAMLANTQWKLSKIANQNNEWVNPSEYPEFDIKDLRFNGDDTYEMKVYNFYGNWTDNTFRGTFYFADGGLNFYTSDIQGRALTIVISYLEKNTLEGRAILWGGNGGNIFT